MATNAMACTNNDGAMIYRFLSLQVNSANDLSNVPTLLAKVRADLAVQVDKVEAAKRQCDMTKQNMSALVVQLQSRLTNVMGMSQASASKTAAHVDVVESLCGNLVDLSGRVTSLEVGNA